MLVNRKKEIHFTKNIQKKHSQLTMEDYIKKNILGILLILAIATDSTTEN